MQSTSGIATASTNVAGRCAGTGGVLSNIKAGLDQQFAEDEIRSIIETAHRLGRRVAARAHGAAGINAALEAGVDSIEHGSFFDARSSCSSPKALSMCLRSLPAPRFWRWHRTTAC